MGEFADPAALGAVGEGIGRCLTSIGTIAIAVGEEVLASYERTGPFLTGGLRDMVTGRTEQGCFTFVGILVSVVIFAVAQLHRASVDGVALLVAIRTEAVDAYTVSIAVRIGTT